MRKLPGVSLLLLLGLAMGTAAAYPTKPIRLLVGYPPGGPTDLTARLTAQHMSDVFGQQVIVDNRPGAGGTVAATMLARSAPDGYTIGLAANGEMAISPNLRSKLPYDPLKDFVPVTRIGASQLVLIIHPSVPAKSVRELIGLAKAKPGAINFASSGTGSTAHLAAELFKTLAGIEMVHVPYKGAGPAMAELMGGQVHMLITAFAGAAPHIKAGKLRALGVTGPKRLSSEPGLPTIGETVSGYEVTSWYGIFAPAGTPKEIAMRLHREVVSMLGKPEVHARFVALGIDPEGNTSDEFRVQIKQEIAKWGKVVKIANVRLE
jgi:tripartite-type tricarboxylate transporter receptor subunit TctC